LTGRITYFEFIFAVSGSFLFGGCPLIVIDLAQVYGALLWFSANSATGELMWSWAITPGDIGMPTYGVQLGFAVGAVEAPD